MTGLPIGSITEVSENFIEEESLQLGKEIQEVYRKRILPEQKINCPECKKSINAPLNIYIDKDSKKKYLCSGCVNKEIKESMEKQTRKNGGKNGKKTIKKA